MMEPIRILHVVGKMHRAGLETFIMNLYRNIDRDKIQFDFLTHYKEDGDYDDEIKKLGGKIYKLSVMEDKNMFLYFKELNDFFKNHKEYKVVHGHWTTFGVFYMYFAQRNGIKFRIAHSHSSDSSPGLRGNLVNVLSKTMKYMSNHYLGCSESAVEWLYGKNSKIKKEGNYKIIKNAIELDKYSIKKETSNDYKERMGIQNNFVIGHIGRFNYSKNHMLIIDIFNHIYSIDKNALLLLIGTGPEKNKVYNKVSELGLEEVVMFLGTRSDIPKLLSIMDVFLFPSKYEALGIVAIEAQAAQIPTIVSDQLPEEAFITKLIKSVPIDSTVKEWVDKILTFKKLSYIDTSELIRKSGYDMHQQIKVMEKYYVDIHKSIKSKNVSNNK